MIGYLRKNVDTICTDQIAHVVREGQGISQNGVCQHVIALASEWTLFKYMRDARCDEYMISIR